MVMPKPESKKKSLIACFIIIILSTLTSAAVWAQPYVPSNRHEVVTTLTNAEAGLSRQLRAAEAAQLTANPDRLFNTIVNAYRLAAITQEARAYGRVTTLLQQWPADIEKPALIHTISAAVLQHNHQFDEALIDLDAVLAINPLDLQAHMIRAQIGLVAGDYGVTQQSCDAMQGIASASVHLNCQAQLDGVSGRAQQALTSIIDGLDNSRLMQSERIELQITAAVLAHRLGQADNAERYYQLALAQSPQNFYTLVHYGNLLLEQNRPADLIRLMQLVPEVSRSTEINILIAEALLTTRDSEAQPLLDTLAENFELAFLRTEAIPHKEYARYALNVIDKPEEALHSASQNWTEQKEPSDALLLAQAAVANADERVLAELYQWIRERGTEHRQLEEIFSAQGLPR